MRGTAPQSLADTPEIHLGPGFVTNPGPKRNQRDQPKMRPDVLVVAAVYRSCTSAQFTTFQNALT